MGAQGDHNDHVFIGHTKTVEIGDELGAHPVLPHPEAGDIADNHGDQIIRTDELRKGRAFHRVRTHSPKKRLVIRLGG
ncbi:hypothetical protein SDC9_123045 [bioreactor metagenome]|uniref:Uncharacterized protein n=1 Tax=bioreactor metagenome TaxID=1076179 RepID=A0A645CGH1_9ZZZZ